MSDKHVINLITEKRIAQLNLAERAALEAHVRECQPCQRAYQATKVMEEMLVARADKTITPLPFFAKRVMAQIKENQRVQQQPTWLTLWRASWAMVSGMVMVVLLLVVLNFINFGSSAPPQIEVAGTQTNNPIEATIFEDSSPPATNLTDNQVLRAVFDSEDDYGDQ